MAYYEREGLKTAIIITIVLLVLALGAGAYFYLTSDAVQAKIAEIDTINYDAYSFSLEKQQSTENNGYSVLEKSGESITADVYMTPLGFPIESYSENWKGEKLKEIYEELLKNKHGEEINYISKIVVRGGVSDLGTKDSVVAGAHSTTQEHYQVFFDVPSIVPQSLEYGINSKQSVIELYNMDEYETIEQAARTIAHEYGHHFTIYYFMANDEQVKNSDYYKIRSFEHFEQPIFFSDQQDYYINHMWSIYEVAAEDYVQLMGSPNTRQTQEYKDIFQVLKTGDKNYRIYADSNTTNVFPQENMNISLADQVPGLREYYYSYIEEQNELNAISEVDFGMSMRKGSLNGYTYYDITWNNVFDDDEALYTLVCYDEDKQINSPIKTVYGNEKAIAKVGTVSKIVGNKIISYSNDVTKEDRYFRLIVMLSDGRIIASGYYYADF